MNRRIGAMTLAISAALLAVSAVTPASADGAKDKVLVFTAPPPGEPVPGAWSKLDREADGIRAQVHTRVESGHAHTLWWAVFNAPEQCAGAICLEPDVFNPATEASVLWAAGAVANDAGRLQFDSWLGISDAPGQVLIGSGLTDPAGAQVVVIVQDHGLAQEDPALLHEQLTMFQGGCNPTCVDLQFAIHLP